MKIIEEQQLKVIENGQFIGKTTIGEMESLIQEAYKEGWESDDLVAQAISISW